jgi:hypothetical protein
MRRGRRASPEIRLILGHGTAPSEFTKQDPPRPATGERPAWGQLGVSQQWPAQAHGQCEAAPRAAEGKGGLGERGIGRLCSFHAALTQPSHSRI